MALYGPVPMDLTPPPLSDEERSMLRRLPSGVCIQRNKPIAFVFNGTRYLGLEADTLASALHANGVSLTARNWLWPRTATAARAAWEESNPVVQVFKGRHPTHKVRMNELALFDGLCAKTLANESQQACDGVHSPRKIAPLESFDLLVVGGGVAGLSAALAAAERGARVLCVDLQTAWGGWLLSSSEWVDGVPAAHWIGNALTRLRAMPGVRLMPHTTAVEGDQTGRWLLRELRYQLAADSANAVDEHFWSIHARQVVLATGSLEQPLAFDNSHLSGVMPASEVRRCIHRFAVLPGSEAVVFTNNDAGYDAALALLAAGAHVTVIDARAQPDGPLSARAKVLGISIMSGHVVLGAVGWRAVRGVKVRRLGLDGAPQGAVGKLVCDLLAVSGGFSPANALMGPWIATDKRLDNSAPRLAGACRDAMDLQACAQDGRGVGQDAALTAMCLHAH
jgi:sarcosine oxidase subunit alpha